MQNIFKAALETLSSGGACVMAMVVRTKGSTPQKAGAKMLVREDGSTVGTLGGGCVEGDIWYIAKEMLRNEEKAQFRSYTLNEELAAQDGLVCGGTMYFFIEPFRSTESFESFARPVIAAMGGGQPLSLAIVVNSPAGAPAPGSKLLIFEDGRYEGSFGNGELERTAAKAGRRLAAFGENELLQAPAETEIYLEGFTTPPTLIIMGGGHVGKAVSNLAAALGYRIIVIDDREEFANPQRFPEAAQTVAAAFDKGLSDLPVNANTYILIATRGHKLDDAALEAAVRTPARYIGLLGSRRKSLLIYKNLHQKGISLERIREVRAPVGLDIGALTPQELAVSIVGEIISVRRGGTGTPMRMDAGEIERGL